MTISQLSQRLPLTPLSLPKGEREFKGVYIGDLLSWVMGRAEADNLWITIMSNINIVAVAALTDVAAILLAEGVTLEENVIDTAREKGINILVTNMTSYELVKKLTSIEQ